VCVCVCVRVRVCWVWVWVGGWVFEHVRVCVFVCTRRTCARA